MSTTVALLVLLAPAGSAAEAGQQTRQVEGQGTAAAPAVYESRPDILLQTSLTTSSTGQQDPNLLLTTPASFVGQPYGGAYGAAAIYDNNGQPVWYQDGRYAHLRQITFRGQPALSVFDYNRGQFVILNSSYQEIAAFGMQGYTPDYHPMDFTDDGSRILMTSYNPVQRDLSQYGGSPNATVMEIVIQEVDTATNQVTFEWSSFDHIPIDETHEPLNRPVVEYLHTNSVAYDNDGNILMSARHTSAIYKIDIDSGEIIWRFGGEANDFTFANPADMPSYQHDATRLPNGNLAAFDNGVGHSPQVSRGAVWQIDEQAMTARLVQSMQSQNRFAIATGSNQPTPSGSHLVNYGTTGAMVEFNGSQQVFTGQFSNGYFTYWAGRTTNWVGTPASPPDVAVSDPDDDGALDVAVSWNGATEVDAWRIEARSEDGAGFEPLATIEKTGFETDAEVTVPDGDADRVRVRALDDNGAVLGSRTLTLAW
ncbi:arylsulfotransferase family protein [Streptomyces sp. B6B3]|uniref:arylsulfotransferase family protein n=1 Tax=Streptomyces sp. B6B3 TaxID=3153570 RepID=UPI00325D2B26